MQPSFLRGMRQDIHKKEYKKRNRINSFFKRAGDGNRTHVSSLEAETRGFSVLCSTN